MSFTIHPFPTENLLFAKLPFFTAGNLWQKRFGFTQPSLSQYNPFLLKGNAIPRILMVTTWLSEMKHSVIPWMYVKLPIMTLTCNGQVRWGIRNRSKRSEKPEKVIFLDFSACELRLENESVGFSPKVQWNVGILKDNLDHGGFSGSSLCAMPPQECNLGHKHWKIAPEAVPVNWVHS